MTNTLLVKPDFPGVEPALDYLVYAAADLEAAVRQVSELCGVCLVEGGRYLGLGTRNYLLGLGWNAYLEVIGSDREQPAPQRPRPFGIDELAGAALVTWAVRPPDLDAAVIRARRLGHDAGPVRVMVRRTPSGEVLRWRLTGPAAAGGQRAGGLLPFLIDWGGSPHPSRLGLPQVRLIGLSARHPDVPAVEAGLAALGVRLTVEPGTAPS